MIKTCMFFLFGVAMIGESLSAQEVAAPKGLPPVTAMAELVQDGEMNDRGEWFIDLEIPRSRWQITGAMVPKREWPELEAEVEMVALQLKFDGPSQLSPARIVDVEGRELERETVLARFTERQPVLVATTMEMPDPFYLQLLKPESLVVILGPREDAPRPDLYPMKTKADSSKN